MAIETIKPKALFGRLTDGGEIALLDDRDEARFLAGHPLPAVHAPLERLLDLAPGFVPRRSTPLVLCDDGDGAAGGRVRALRDRPCHGQLLRPRRAGELRHATDRRIGADAQAGGWRALAHRR